MPLKLPSDGHQVSSTVFLALDEYNNEQSPDEFTQDEPVIDEAASKDQIAVHLDLRHLSVNQMKKTGRNRQQC